MNEVVFEFDDGSIARWRLDDAELSGLISAAFYGNGWFRFTVGSAQHLVNLAHVLKIEVTRDE